MREKLVKRYYCEHCSKGGFKKPSIQQHEKGCTRNPERLCYLCEETHDYKSLCAEAIKRSSENEVDHRIISEAEDLMALSRMVSNCPACLLAVLRQSNVFAFEHFDYKTELTKYHREQSQY